MNSFVAAGGDKFAVYPRGLNHRGDPLDLNDMIA
jgi:hypothetical protein